MPLKSTQTNKYETACFIQETPTSSELSPNGYKVTQSSFGTPIVDFDATYQTFNCYNRMGRRYDGQNLDSVIKNDERIQTLLRQNKWESELNHPNADIKGQQLSDIRMTIPDPLNVCGFISKPRLEGDRYRGHFRTQATNKAGQYLTSLIVDQGGVPSFSVRLLGNMIPNARPNQPNIRVTKVITFDCVSFPSHHDANADITPRVMTEGYQMNLDGDENGYGKVIFLQELAKYCVEQSENLQVVMESFEISLDEVMGIHNGSIVIEQADMSRIRIPLVGDTRREAINILRGLK